MDDENNKKAEARRVLDSIRQNKAQDADEETVPQKPIQWLAGDDAAQLKALVDQKRKIKTESEEEEETLLDPESIDPISVDQIKVMRKYAVNRKAGKISFRQAIYESMIRAFVEIVDYFKPSVRAKRCLTEGHHCLHCGKKFDEPLIGAPGASDSAESQKTTKPKVKNKT